MFRRIVAAALALALALGACTKVGETVATSSNSGATARRGRTPTGS